MPARPTLQEACARFVHRFTMEHVPAWAVKQRSDGTFYAPHFASDLDWYKATKFHGEDELATRNSCHTSGQTWPLGQSLVEPYRQTTRTTPSQQWLRGYVVASK